METVCEPVTLSTADTYIKIGTQSYTEHYLHLWENQIPTYVKSSFTKKVVQQELNDPNCLNYLVKHNKKKCGYSQNFIGPRLGGVVSRASPIPTPNLFAQ